MLKHHKHKLCLLFIFLFFAYRICTPLNNVDSCSFHSNNSTFTKSILSSHFFIPEHTQCTFQMPVTNQSTYITDTNINLSKQTVHFLCIIPSNSLLNHLFFYQYKFELQGNFLKKCHSYTIKYIHHKDGKKRKLIQLI